jgi:hypothetical protein
LRYLGIIFCVKKPLNCCLFFIFTLKVSFSNAESKKLADFEQTIFLFEDDEWVLAIKNER